MTLLGEATAQDNGLRDGVEDAVRRATGWLKAHQDAGGWWKGELETNVTMDAEDVLLRHFLGILEPGTLAEAAQWIRSNQLAEGPWATFYGGPGELSATVEAYVALRLAGDGVAVPVVRFVAAHLLEPLLAASGRGRDAA